MRNWNDISVFLSVARSGSTTAASKELGVAQTTVSRRMDALEAELRMTLFRREARGFLLTRDGARLLEIIAPISEAFDRVEAEISELQRPINTLIRVTAPAEGMHHWLMPVLESFRARHNGVRLELDTSEAQLDLVAGDADLALRMADQIEDERLIARRIGFARWGVYCSRRHYQSYGAPRSFDDICVHDIVQYKRDIAQRIAPVRSFGERISPDRVILNVSSVPAMVSALRSSGGLGVLPCVVGDNTPDLVPCFSDEGLRHNCWLAANPDAYKRPLIRQCMSWIGQEFPRDAL